MYDRKTWIGLILCTISLFVYFYFSGKNRVAEAASQAAEKKAAQEESALLEQSRSESASTETASTPDQGGKSPNTTAIAEASEPAIAEETHTLKTDKTVFTFTNKGGGLQLASLLDEDAVNNPDARVEINDQIETPIGALGTSPDNFIEGTLQVHSSDEKHIAYVGKTSSGIGVYKKWELVESDSKGSPYQLKLTLTLRNPKDASGSINLSSHNLFLGTPKTSIKNTTKASTMRGSQTNSSSPLFLQKLLMPPTSGPNKPPPTSPL